MFFLIRCVFWLTIVFSTIFNTDQRPAVPARPAEKLQHVQSARQDSAAKGAFPQRLGQRVQDWVTAAIEAAGSKAAGSCAAAPGGCVALAARLSDFARHYSFDGSGAENNAAPAKAEAAQMASPPASAVPLPPLRPQRARLLVKPAK